MSPSAACAGLLAIGLLLGSAGQAQQTIDRNSNPAAATSAGAAGTSDPKAATSAADEMLGKLKQAGVSGSPEAAAPYLPKVWCGEIPDEPTKAVCWKAYRASLDYYAVGLTHRTKVFQWQHTSTVVIFWVVIALVAAGLFFAWLQFKAALEPRSSNTRDPEGPAVVAVSAGPGTSTVEFGKEGFKISSPVLGVIILALSLGFFYLYLVYAYPIHELF